MSWSASWKSVPGELERVEVQESNIVGDEHVLQYKAVKVAVAEILFTDALGGPEKGYRVVVGGHGNPDHEPVEGWSNDCITINIYQLDEE